MIVIPVTAGKKSVEISQRRQYQKGGIGRSYWDFRDQVSLSFLVGTRILDLGCGEGITLEKLFNSFPKAKVWGIDADSENISICNSNYLPILRGSLYSLPFPDETFDSCLLLEVIEHLEEPTKALREISRVLCLGGRLIVVYPIDWAFWLVRVLTCRFQEASFDPGHLRQWNRWTLGRQLRKCGLKPIIVKGLPLFWPFMLHGLIVAEKRAWFPLPMQNV